MSCDRSRRCTCHLSCRHLQELQVKQEMRHEAWGAVDTFRELLLADPVFFNLVLKGPQADPEQVGSFFTVVGDF